jgi:hypothetical protein
MGNSFMVGCKINMNLGVGMGRNWLGLVGSYKCNNMFLNYSNCSLLNIMIVVSMDSKRLVESLM